MDKDVVFAFLKNHPLLEGFTDEQIINLQNKLTEERFAPNDIIIEEGETTTDVYLIFEGQVGVLKWNEEYYMQALIERLNKGNAFGESAFLQQVPRSTTIKAIRPTIVFKIKKELFSTPLMKDAQLAIFANIAHLNTERLRLSNVLLVRNLEKTKHLTQTWVKIGQIILFQYFALLLSAFTASYFSADIQLLILWTMAAIFGFVMIKFSGYTGSDFGLNLKNWPKVVCTSLFIGCIAILSTYFLHWLMSLENTNFAMLSRLSSKISYANFSGVNLLLYALYSFMQEFTLRGILQKGLMEFLQDKKGYKSVFLNSCFILILLLPLGWVVSLNAFLISVPMGLLFLKQDTLLGVFLIHFLLCLTGLSQ